MLRDFASILVRSKRDYHVDGQIGMEPTVEAYVAKMVAVFGAVRRVLRDDGVCFVNLGDSYAGSGWSDRNGAIGQATVDSPAVPVGGLKPLDLCLVPERVALAMQADGWWLRSVIIWAKPSPMPESVGGTRWERCRVKVAIGTRQGNNKNENGDDERAAGFNARWDGKEGASAQYEHCPGCAKCAPHDGWVLRRGSGRPTTAHEYIYMFTKSASYYWNTEAVREPLSASTLADHRNGTGRHTQDSEKYTDEEQLSWYRAKQFVNPSSGRNMRSVWTFPSEGSGYKHFAMFPQRLPELCILAATSPVGVCPSCGAQYAPMVEVSAEYQKMLDTTSEAWFQRKQTPFADGKKADNTYHSISPEIAVLGYKPTCDCLALPPVPATILDPFCGTATTCIVARKLGRRSIGIDLSEPYLEIAVKRLAEAKHSQQRMQV